MGILISAKFRTWHEKYEHLYPWLPHFYATVIHSVCCTLADLDSDYTQKYVISRGQSLPTTAYDPVINLMVGFHMMLKSGMRTNSISTLDRPPTSYQFFNRSIETDQHAIQQINLTTGKPVNRGENQDETTRTRTRNIDDPPPPPKRHMLVMLL